MPFQLFRHSLRACGLTLGLSLGMAHAGALTVSQGAAEPTPSESPSPSQWLRLIGQAARQSSYEGTVMMSSAGRSSSVQVSHRVSGEELFEKIEPLDGPERQIYRHNDDIQILWPHKKTVLVQQRGALL